MTLSVVSCGIFREPETSRRVIECTVPNASRFSQALFCLEGYRLRSFDLLVRETCS